MAKSATLQDIADRVGVGPSTVSAVLRKGKSAHVRVSEKTRQMVLDTARDLNYSPNRAARSLRSQRTNVIGFYTLGYIEPTMPFLLPVIGGLHHGCVDNGNHLLIHGRLEGQSVQDTVRELTDGHIDGAVLLTGTADPIIAPLVASGLPLISVTNALPGMQNVVADDAEGSRLLARHLAKNGHRNIAYFPSVMSLQSAAERQQAFQEEATRLGMEVTEWWSDWATLDLARNPFSAAVCWNDDVAYALLEHLRASGIEVPGKIAVTGFDGIAPTRPTPWSLTTIVAPWVEIARTAAELLIRGLNGEDVPSSTVLPVHLKIGDTT